MPRTPFAIRLAVWIFCAMLAAAGGAAVSILWMLFYFRFHAKAVRENPHVCYCRMCQKAFGNYFSALTGDRKSVV